MASHKRKKFAAIDDKYLAIGICRGVGGPRLPVEHRDFPEDLTGADKIENRAAAIGRGDAHFHGATDHRKKTVPWISFGKQRGSPLQRGVLRVAAELVEGLGFKIAKNRMLAQHRQFVARKRPTPAVFVVEHAGHNHLNDLCLRIIDRPRCVRVPTRNYRSAALVHIIPPHSGYSKKGRLPPQPTMAGFWGRERQFVPPIPETGGIGSWLAHPQDALRPCLLVKRVTALRGRRSPAGCGVLSWP